MKQFILLCTFLSFLAFNVEAAGSFNDDTKENFATYLQNNLESEGFSTTTVKEIEAEIGRKLTFKEKVAVKVLKKDAKKSATAGGSKSQLVALLLCFFLGVLGIHRFYLGYTGIGIIQLLTGGGFGIWLLIDFIRIIIGDLKPKDGNDYDPSL
jgi:TM2 domain-containing membrane protein YozV